MQKIIKQTRYVGGFRPTAAVIKEEHSMGEIKITLDHDIETAFKQALTKLEVDASTYFEMVATQLVSNLDVKTEQYTGMMTPELARVLLTERAKMLGLIPDDATFPAVDYDKRKEQYRNGEL